MGPRTALSTWLCREDLGCKREVPHHWSGKKWFGGEKIDPASVLDRSCIQPDFAS